MLVRCRSGSASSANGAQAWLNSHASGNLCQISASIRSALFLMSLSLSDCAAIWSGLSAGDSFCSSHQIHERKHSKCMQNIASMRMHKCTSECMQQSACLRLQAKPQHFFARTPAQDSQTTLAAFLPGGIHECQSSSKKMHHFIIEFTGRSCEHPTRPVDGLAFQTATSREYLIHRADHQTCSRMLKMYPQVGNLC